MATGEHPRLRPDLYTTLGITEGASMQDIWKAYRTLATKWHPDKHHSNRSEAEDKFAAINDAYMEIINKNNEDVHKFEEAMTPGVCKRSKDDGFFAKRPSFLSRTRTKRSQIPTPTSLSTSGSRRDSSTYFPSSPLTSQTSTPTSMSNSPAFITSPGSTGQATTPTKNSPRSPEDPFSAPLNISPPTFIGSTLSRSRRSSSETQLPSSFWSSASRKISTANIIFSQSTVRKKPPPIEKKLKCTLEDLCHGCVKKINFTRDVITPSGIIQEEEKLKIRIQPGWKNGTKITFERKGDEKPGFLPADIIFVIEEKKHPLFKRRGDDLEIGIEIPLVKALTGCSISVPLLGGERTNLSIEDVIYPGYEEVIPGQGMPNARDGRRGDLRIKFLVEFPTELSDQQRSEAYNVLKDCC